MPAVAKLLSLVLVAVLAVACSSKKPDRGGLMIVISSDGTLPIDLLRIRIDNAASGKVLRQSDHKVPAETTLPTTLAIASNGDPSASARITVSAWGAVLGVETPLDVREALIYQIPVDRIATVPIVLSAKCTALVIVAPMGDGGSSNAQPVSSCGDKNTCDPATGKCVSSVIDGTKLPTFNPGMPVEMPAADATVPAADAASEGAVSIPADATSTSDAADAADAADASNAMDRSDATDATDASDTTDASDGGCLAGYKNCAGLCVPTDVGHGCGAASCIACGASHGTASCDAMGKCALACDATYKSCGGVCVAVSDPTYGCGDTTCDMTPCPAAGTGTLVCSGKMCQIGACGAGTKKCGAVCVPTDSNNGCADPARCTACATSETCVGAPTSCQCVPESMATTCARVQCGLTKNNCGTNIDCGTAACTGAMTCGGGGIPNVCGCTDEAVATTCSGGRCGSQTNNCGRAVACPASSCAPPQTCGGGGTANVCGGCDWTSTYPPAAGCPAGNFTWACWPEPPTNRALGGADYTIRTLCSNDVVIDNTTRLMWARNEEPVTTWDAAKASCVSSRRSGFADWRLPTTQELLSLVDYTKSAFPLMDVATFQGPTLGSMPATPRVWTSTPSAMIATYAWYVNFGLGNPGTRGTANGYGVRCVR